MEGSTFYLVWKKLLVMLLAVFPYTQTQLVDVTDFQAQIVDMAHSFLGADEFQVRRLRLQGDNIFIYRLL